MFLYKRISRIIYQIIIRDYRTYYFKIYAVSIDLINKILLRLSYIYIYDNIFYDLDNIDVTDTLEYYIGTYKLQLLYYAIELYRNKRFDRVIK